MGRDQATIPHTKDTYDLPGGFKVRAHHDLGQAAQIPEVPSR